MTCRALTLALWFAVALLAAELTFVYLAYPWELLGFWVLGMELGYLLAARYSQLHEDDEHEVDEQHEDDEPIEKIQQIRSRPPDFVTEPPQSPNPRNRR